MRSFREMIAATLIALHAVFGIILIAAIGFPVTILTFIFFKGIFVVWLIDRLEDSEKWIIDRFGPVDFG